MQANDGKDFQHCVTSFSCDHTSNNLNCTGGSNINNTNCVEHKKSIDRNTNGKIYRFKFTDDFMSQLHSFSKIHQYDDKKTFKDAWSEFTLENELLVNTEIRRIAQLGYEGDIMDKMFKSARYYFRKKSNVKNEPKERRQYITFDNKLLDAMDKHILQNLKNEEYQPKTGFTNFCKENETLVRENVAKLYENGLTDSKTIEDKFKKTYKNRYFMITRK